MFIASRSFFIAIALAFAFSARAELPMGWTSVRALGMGNAYTAVAADSDAIMYNPAMLMKSKGIAWRVMNPRAGIDNPSNLQLAGQLSNVSDVAATVNTLYGKDIWIGGGALSGVTIPYFGFAAYANTEVGLHASSPPNTRINTNYFFDYGGAIGFALPFIPSIWSQGITVRSINRTGTTNVLGPGTLAETTSPTAFEAEFKRRGNAYAVDYGMAVTIPGPISPAVSLVYRNMGYTSFSFDQGAGAPPRIEPELITGASLTVDVPLITITGALDYRYIGWTGITMGSNVGMGLEISLPLIDIRGGMHQGYYTAGVGLDLGIIRADVATWAVELGVYPGQEVDRRYMAQLTIEIGFDPAKFLGNFGGGSGKSGEAPRRLKQRR